MSKQPAGCRNVRNHPFLLFSAFLSFSQNNQKAYWNITGDTRNPVNGTTVLKKGIGNNGMLFLVSVYSNGKLSYKIISAPHNTFGYDIYDDGKLIIHQNSIPGLPGNKGFATKANAEKVAKLVISKINAGEMPPTVNIEELKKLKAI